LHKNALKSGETGEIAKALEKLTILWTSARLARVLYLLPPSLTHKNSSKQMAAEFSFPHLSDNRSGIIPTP